MTLREQALDAVDNHRCAYGPELIEAIAALLEATGDPAHIRVAKDLRGEWEEGVCDEPGCDNDSTEIDMDTGRESCALHHDVTP